MDEDAPERNIVNAGSTIGTLNTFYNLAFTEDTTVSLKYILNSKPTLDAATVLSQRRQTITGGAVTTDWEHNVALPAGLAAGTYYMAVVATAPNGEEFVSDFEANYVIADKYAPEITAPVGDFVVPQDRPDGALVDYPVSIWDDTDGAPVLTSNYPSGPIFPLGITVVNLTATDRSGKRSTHSFRVVVTGSPEVTGFELPMLHSIGTRVGQVAAADVNEDGYPDLVAINWTNRSVSVQLNRGDRTFGAPVFFGVGSPTVDQPERLIVADLNRDGHLDLAVTNRISNTVSVLLGNGLGSFSSQQTYAVGNLPTAIVLADFDGNSIPDLAVSNFADGGLLDPSSISVLLGNGDGTFQSAQTFSTLGPLAYALVAGDFNGDGNVDLATATNDDRLRIFIGNGNGTFSAGPVYTTPSGPFSLYAGDLDGDSTTDLLSASLFGNSNQVAQFTGIGNGTFRAPSYFSVAQSPTSFVVGDVNGDNRTDFAVATSSTLQIFRGRGNGTFESPVSMAAGGTTLADFDRDGSPDLAGPDPNAFSNAIDVLYNRTNAELTERTGYHIAGQQGVNLNDVLVAHFDDPNIHAQLGDYTVAIDWGDGMSSAGIVEADPAGGFTIKASHSYAEPGDYVLNVIVDDLGKTASLVATATIENTPPIFGDNDVQISAAQLVEGQSIELSGSFVNPSVLENHLVSINWGDGSEVLFIDLGTTDRSFRSAHQYTAAGNYQIEILVIDYRGASLAMRGIVVEPRNNPPSLDSVPAVIRTFEGFSTPINGIQISDPDSGVRPVTISLTVTDGSLWAAVVPGITVGMSGTASLSLTGSVADLNAYLAVGTANVSYNPGMNFSGDDELGVVVNDNGNTGYGGPALARSETIITVLPGDRSGTIGLYSAGHGAFFLRDSNSSGFADHVFRYGPTDVKWLPISGDWNGDGVDSVGLYNPAAGAFLLRNSHAPGPADIAFVFGPTDAGWQPIAGDWDGDGVDTVGLYSPVAGAFFLRNAHAPGPADVVFSFGPADAGLRPIAGDWNGDAIDTVGLFSPIVSAVFLRNVHAGGAADAAYFYGPPDRGWFPIAGDWNNDRIDTIGLEDPGAGAFFLRNENAAGIADVTFAYGPGAGWFALAGNWNGIDDATLRLEASTAPSGEIGQLEQAAAQAARDAALVRWAVAGLNATLLRRLAAVNVQVADLPGEQIGLALHGIIYVDRDAAGHGWFVDATPEADEEFTAESGEFRAKPGLANDRVDLLSVVLHELGHELGLVDLDPVTGATDLMVESLAPGVRRLPTSEIVDRVFSE